MFRFRSLFAELSAACLVQTCSIALLYFGADVVLNAFVLGVHGWEVFWPLNGVTIALLLTQPRRRWLPLLAAIEISTATAEYSFGESGVLVLVDVLIFSTETLFGAMMLPAFRDLESWLHEPRIYPRFLVAAVIGPLLATVLDSALGALLTRGNPFLPSLLNSAPGEVIGVSAMVPLVLALRSVAPGSFRDLRWWTRMLGVTMATAVVMTGMFMTGRYPALFVLYPFLMWVEAVSGLLGSSIALCCACVLAVVLTQAGYGPFAHELPSDLSQHLAVEFYLAFHLISFLPVSIMSMERRRLMRELTAALKDATRLAAVDGLTGLSNRRTFDSRLREQWELALRHRKSLALLMLDVDYFKAFNDKLGHQAGDDCLQAVAHALKAYACRPTDLVARFGGEEFVILLPDTSLEGAGFVAEQVRAAIFDLAITHPGAVPSSGSDRGRVTLSIGCAALIPQQAGGAQDLIQCADEALYTAKQSGRNRVCVSRGLDKLDSPPLAMRRLQRRIKTFAARSLTVTPRS